MGYTSLKAQRRLQFSDGWQKLLFKTGCFLLLFAAPAAASEALASAELEPALELSNDTPGLVTSAPADAPSEASKQEPSLQTATAAAANQSSVTVAEETAIAPPLPPEVSTLAGDLTAATHPQLGGSFQASQIAQVTSVGQLSDVLPTDWAFQALQSLVEQYGCIQGYPDGTYRGRASLTRYEFAAGLSACLDVIAQLVSTSIDPEDLATIRRLQEEFQAELVTLQQRVDGLEVATAELEANQFATQTKLRGNVFFHLGNAVTGGGILAEGINAFVPARNPATLQPVVRTVEGNSALTYGYLTFINMDTSFTGADRLNLQIVAGNGTAPANLYVSAGLFNTYGTPFTFQNGASVPNDFAIRELSYSFPVGDRITVDIGPRINWYRYFDATRYTFFVTGANSFNSSGGTQVNTVDRGAGAIAVWNATDWLDLRLGYLAESNEFLPGLRPPGNPSVGLFGGTNTLTAQVGIRPATNLNLRFLYTRSSLAANAAGFVGGSTSEPFYGFADDGLGGPLSWATADTFLVNFDWQPANWLGFFGRYSYGSTDLQAATPGRVAGNIDGYSLQLGVAFPDLFREGALATISYLQPFNVTGGRNFLVSGGGDGGRQHEVEVTYRYPLNRNIAIVPSVYWIGNANNFSTNPDIFIFNLQTQFFF